MKLGCGSGPLARHPPSTQLSMRSATVKCVAGIVWDVSRLFLEPALFVLSEGVAPCHSLSSAMQYGVLDFPNRHLGTSSLQADLG
jgi:hypothetical protein